MRLPADPATDVPRLARVTSGAPLPPGTAPDAALQRGSYGRALSARASAPLQDPSVPRPPSIASTRAVSEPVAGRTLRSALEQVRQQTAQSPPGKGTIGGGCSRVSRSSLSAVSDSSTPLVRDSGQERDGGGMPHRESLDGYVLQASRATETIKHA